MLPWARFSFVEPTELIGTVLEIVFGASGGVR